MEEPGRKERVQAPGVAFGKSDQLLEPAPLSPAPQNPRPGGRPSPAVSLLISAWLIALP